MQAIERAADNAGHTYATMMEAAGRSVADVVLARFQSNPVLILAGPGNNGGDGLVCARFLHEAGVLVRVYLWKRLTDSVHDYEGHFQRLAVMGVEASSVDSDPVFSTLRRWSDGAVVIDALLGTGANRPIEGQLAALLDTIREAHGEFSARHRRRRLCKWARLRHWRRQPSTLWFQTSP